MAFKNKLKKLKNILKRMQSVVIAYSGGVDSSLLLKIAKDILKENVLAVIARSETYPESEIREAKKFAQMLKVKYSVIKTEELNNPSFNKNPLNRCFFCKKELFSKLKRIAESRNFNYVIDGSNFDDRKDFRPGARAAKKLKVRSPLKEAKLTKNDIRKLSRNLGLTTWDKPSFACLASRFPYGRKLNKKDLRRVEVAEQFLRKLGFKQIRLRHYNNTARIEVLKNEIPKVLKHQELIIESLKKLGYNYICLDLEGYRTGSMNETINKERKNDRYGKR